MLRNEKLSEFKRNHAEIQLFVLYQTTQDKDILYFRNNQ